MTIAPESADAAIEDAGDDTAGAGDAQSVTGAPLDEDELFHLLRNERRRRTLRYLLDAEEEPVKLGDLAETIAAAEYDTTVQALDSDRRQRVYITLYQSHLPQLEKAGVIEYDKNRGTIALNPSVHEFDEYVIPRSEDVTDADTRIFSVIAGFGLGGLLTLAVLQSVGVVDTLALLLFLGTAAAAIGLERRVGSPDTGFSERIPRATSEE